MEEVVPTDEETNTPGLSSIARAVSIPNSSTLDTHDTVQNVNISGVGTAEVGSSLDNAIRDEVQVMCELAAASVVMASEDESNEIHMDDDNVLESNVLLPDGSVGLIIPELDSTAENAMEDIQEVNGEGDNTLGQNVSYVEEVVESSAQRNPLSHNTAQNAMEDLQEVNGEHGYALGPPTQITSQAHNGTESTMEDVQEVNDPSVPIIPPYDRTEEDVMQEQHAVNHENVLELEDLVESPVHIIQLSDSDAEDVMEEDREMVGTQEEGELEDIRYATNGRNWAVDMVFNMYNREVEAAAMERRQNQGQNSSEPLHLETPINNLFPFRSQRLLQIRRALLVIDSNRRARIGQRVTNEDGDGAVNGEVESSPAVEDEAQATLPDDDEVPENAIRFDTNLAAEHSYLGVNMNRVSGVEYLDVNEEYNMMLFLHQHIVYPGEVLPFMISGAIIDADVDSTNGMFGVCFPFMRSKNGAIYGVTCQIYEKGTDERGHTAIKSRALQRFVTTSDTHIEHLEYINDNPRVKHGHVRILPEIFLPEPLNCIYMGSFNRFRDISSMKRQFQRYQAATTIWPAHVYNYYNISSIVEKARESLAQHEIDTMPTDPVQLSFWLARNLHLSEEMMKKIFTNDTVNLRMKIIASTLQEESIFVCRICGNRIANCSELFAMSKHGVQTQYCNSAGYIHETNTVYKVLRDAVSYSGEPSSKFSWFPGYKWHIIVCKMCARHIGWEFKAMEPNLLPKSFFGISSSSVRVSDTNSEITSPREGTLRNFMRLARRDME